MKARKKKIDYNAETMRIACAICGIGMDTKTADAIVQISKAMREKGDQFNVYDACVIKAAIEAKYPSQSLSEGEPKVK